MSRRRAFYSALQYVPDGSRAEAANVGAVIYLPDSGQVVVRTSPNLNRVKKFFAPDQNDLRRIGISLESLKHRLELANKEFASEEEFRRFAASRADVLKFSNPKLIAVDDAQQKIEELYMHLVGDVEADATTRIRVGFPSEVSRIFLTLVERRVAWNPRSIQVPETKARLNIPLAYRNGRVNYVIPQSLDPGKNPGGRLPKLGFNGLLIYQHKIEDSEGKLVVMSADGAATKEIEAQYAEVLDDFHVDFIRYSEAVDYAKKVEKNAH